MMMEHKFLCDQMILDLGRWLRAAGYDTAFSKETEKDLELIRQAIAEHRHLLTRDAEFLKMKEAKNRVIYFGMHSLDECAKLLNHSLNINWLYKPFSRCLICNTLLVLANEEKVKAQVPQKILSVTQQFWYCDHCQKIFWTGSNTRNMLKQLAYWANEGAV